MSSNSLHGMGQVVAEDIRATPEATAEQILARRELSRRRLLPFLMNFEPNYLAGWVHKDITQRLEKFTDDIIHKRAPRLMLTMPPRHGKSLIASTYYPAWFLGQYPELEIIATSYSGSLASKFSRSVRHVFREPVFQRIFEAELDPDAQSVENWFTTKGGSYTAAGVGGGITGRGAHLLIIDDPIKSAEDAESDTYREALWDWYTSTAYTRLAPGGGVLIIQTRWHHDDLAGRLAQKSDEGEGDTFTQIDYPARAMSDEAYRDKNTPLHPERYDTAALAMIERAVGPRVWQALYQQQPTADTGSYFKQEWMRFYDKAPPLHHLNIYAAWDMAIGQKEHNDYTVGAVCGVDNQGDIWVLHMVRGRWDAMEIVEQILNVCEVWRPTQTLIEKGHIDMAIGPFLEKRKAERKLWQAVFKSLPTGRRDKMARARGIQGLFEQGRVKLPQYGNWVDPLNRELLTFPFGKHDDMVDALAWIGIYLVELTGGRALQKSAIPVVSWKDKLSKYIGNAGSTKSAMSS